MLPEARDEVFSRIFFFLEKGNKLFRSCSRPGLVLALPPWLTSSHQTLGAPARPRGREGPLPGGSSPSAWVTEAGGRGGGWGAGWVPFTYATGQPAGQGGG